GGAHVVPDGVLVRGRVPQLGEIGGEEPVGNRLAVHQHTVVVEDDQVIAHTSTLNAEIPRAERHGGSLSQIVRRRPTLPQGPPCSTIGAVRLSFRVRNVTGRFPYAMTTETLMVSSEQAHSSVVCSTQSRQRSLSQN